MEHTTHKKAAEALSPVEQLSTGARDLIDNALDESRKTWKNVRKQGLDAWDNAVESGQGAVDDAVQDTEKLIRKYPARALGVAFVAGALIAAFFLPRNQD